MAGSLTTGTVKPIFDSLIYGTALEGESLLKAWLLKHEEKFGSFVDGEWRKTEEGPVYEAKNVYKDEVLASVCGSNGTTVTSAIQSSERAFQAWSSLSSHLQSSHLYSIARNLQKHQSLLAVTEAVNTGRLAKEVRAVDVPAAIRSFYHYAGWATLRGEELKAWKPIGIVAIVVGNSCPLIQTCSRVAAALAMGNAVILQPCPTASLSTFLLVDICAQAGLPTGMLNVVCSSVPETLASKSKIGCIAVAASKEVGLKVRQGSAGLGTRVSLELTSNRNAVVVLEDCDIDSAVEGVIDSAFSGTGQTNTCASRLLIQEPIFETVVRKLKARMSKLTIGNNLDKNSDIGPMPSPDVVDQVRRLIDASQRDGAEVFKACEEPQGSLFVAPTLIVNEQPSGKLFTSQLPAPIVLALPFRTLKEAMTISNHSCQGMNASVWSEDINVALEATAMLNVGTVWINCQNVRDAGVGVGGNKASGYGRMGGKMGLLEFAQPCHASSLTTLNQLPVGELKKYAASSNPASLLPEAPSGQGDGIDKTYKLFYGGAQKRPDSNSYQTVKAGDGAVSGYVPFAGQKDVRNAVDAAFKAASGWRKKEGHGKAQIMYYMAENLQGKRHELISQMMSVSNKNESEAEAEFETTIQRLFYWAAWCDKNGGSVEQPSFPGMTVKLNEPVGVIGVVCPSDFPLLGFVSLIAPAIAFGNTVVVVPSASNPIPGLAFHQILETSDVPAGVVNILSGNVEGMTKTLSEHHDVSAVWFHAPSSAGSQFVEHASVQNFKRVWVNHGQARDWLDSQQGQGEEFSYHCINPKTVWIPVGDIFAN